MVTSEKGRFRIGDLDQEAMARIGIKTKELMLKRYGPAFDKWLEMHHNKARALAHCTWLALQEELNRE